MKKKKNNKLKHLENVFMNTPVASVNESTGSSKFIWDTMYEEKSDSVSPSEAGAEPMPPKKGE